MAKKKGSLGTKSVPEVEVVVFKNRSRKRKLDADGQGEGGDQGPRTKAFDFKKARHEVFKFGIAGMDKEEKVSAKEALMLKLGARPERRKRQNYKVLMEERKVQKEVMTKERQEGNVRYKATSAAGRSGSSKKKGHRRDPNAPRGGLAYQVGKFKDGVLDVSKKAFAKTRK